MTKFIATLTLALGIAIASFAGGTYAERAVVDRQTQLNSPYCPEEDSCRADYQNGHWYIIEETP